VVKIAFPITAIPRDHGDYGDLFLCLQRFSPCLRASVVKIASLITAISSLLGGFCTGFTAF